MLPFLPRSLVGTCAFEILPNRLPKVWSDVNFQRSFLDKVSKELGITKV